MAIKKFLLLFLLACCFGPSFLFIKLGVSAIPPFTLVFLRVALAGLLLYPCLRFMGKRLSSYRHLWKHFLFMGACSCTIPFFLITHAEQTISSGLAGLLNGTAPIFTTLLTYYFSKSDPMTPQKIGGVLLSVLGLAFVFTPHILSGDTSSLLGIFSVVLACLFYGIGMVYSRKHLSTLPPLVAPVGQLFAASLLALPFALVFERPFTLPPMQAIGGVVGLAVIGTALAFIFYYQIIRVAGAFYLSLCTFLFPLISILLGAIFLGERLEWNVYLGGLLILSGLGLATEIIGIKKRRYGYRKQLVE